LAEELRLIGSRFSEPLTSGVEMKKQSERAPWWGAKVEWNGKAMYVDLIGDWHVHLCPSWPCHPFTHDHLKVATFLLRWDPDAGLFRMIWDRPQNAA
jgi:hypothetical protein